MDAASNINIRNMNMFFINAQTVCDIGGNVKFMILQGK